MEKKQNLSLYHFYYFRNQNQKSMGGIGFFWGRDKMSSLCVIQLCKYLRGNQCVVSIVWSHRELVRLFAWVVLGHKTMSIDIFHPISRSNIGPRFWCQVSFTLIIKVFEKTSH